MAVGRPGGASPRAAPGGPAGPGGVRHRGAFDVPVRRRRHGGDRCRRRGRWWAGRRCAHRSPRAPTTRCPSGARVGRCPSGAPPARRVRRRGDARRLPERGARKRAARWARVHRGRPGPGDAGRYADHARWRGRAAGRPRAAARRQPVRRRSGPARGRQVLRRPAPGRSGRRRADRRACRRRAARHGRAGPADRGRVGGPPDQRPDGAAAASRRDARRVRRGPDDGPVEQRRPGDGRSGRLRSVGQRVGREGPPYHGNGPGRRARRVSGEAPAGRPGHPRPGGRWVSAVVRRRGRRAPAALLGAAAARGRRGRLRVARRPGDGPLAAPPRPGAVDRSTGGGTARSTLARGWRRRGLRAAAARTRRLRRRTGAGCVGGPGGSAGGMPPRGRFGSAGAPSGPSSVRCCLAERRSSIQPNSSPATGSSGSGSAARPRPQRRVLARGSRPSSGPSSGRSPPRDLTVDPLLRRRCRCPASCRGHPCPSSGG